MKKLSMVVILLITCMVCGVSQVNAQTKAQVKSAEKTAKKRAKELSKQGWKLNGSLTLEAALKSHYLKTEEFGGQGTEYVGNAPSVKNLKLGGQQARSDIRSQYAEQTSAIVKGRINDGSTDIADDQMMNFVSAYETMVMKEIDGALQPSYAIYKQKKDGMYEMQVFFILDEVKAGIAKRKALENAAKNLQLSQKIADDMSDFINKGFKGLNAE